MVDMQRPHKGWAHQGRHQRLSQLRRPPQQQARRAHQRGKVQQTPQT